MRYALEGSVRKAGSNLRITSQVVDTTTDSTLWSDKFSGTLDDVFDIQERVSRAIVKALRVQLTDREDRRLRAPTTPNGYVYDTYVRARRDIWSFVPERLARAEEELTRALAAAGDHVLLHDGLGTLHWQYINSGISGDRRHLAEAERYARKVMELDPGSAAGPRLMGLIAAQSGDEVGWVHYLNHAASIEPHDPYTVIWLAYGWTWAGFPGRSRPLYERILAIDPFFDYLLFGLGFEAYFAGDYAEAERRYEQARQLSPDHPGIVMALAQTFASAGQIDRMVRWVEDSAPDPHGHPLHTLSHLFKHALVGEAAAADAARPAEGGRALAHTIHRAWAAELSLPLHAGSADRQDPRQRGARISARTLLVVEEESGVLELAQRQHAELEGVAVSRRDFLPSEVPEGGVVPRCGVQGLERMVGEPEVVEVLFNELTNAGHVRIDDLTSNDRIQNP